ncbi:hypothetical protein K502DRAFT_325344 [Neoconidiobolus thromboides FSU 785]|nr:hypothetical protein K502DRAFT_325344 [Neoconidiobolus thromboides FSU 785]
MIHIHALPQTLKNMKLNHIKESIFSNHHYLNKLSNPQPKTLLNKVTIGARANPGKPHFTTQPKYTMLWWKDVLIVGTVFSITGSLSLKLVQPSLNFVGIQGNFKDGPWTYRAAHLTLSPPSWCLMLVTIGTLFGKQAYFAAVAKRVLSRFMIGSKVKSALLTKAGTHHPSSALLKSIKY